MSLFQRGDVWWYEFWFAGRRIQESSKSLSKTVAKASEQRRRRELAEGYNSFEDVRHERVRTVNEIATDFLASYKLRNPQSAVFATYAVRHLQRVIGDRMLVEVSVQTVRDYQDHRLREKASPKTVNDEVGFLLRVMEDAGDLLRIRLKKKHLLKLKVRKTVGKAYSDQEKTRMLECARVSRSPHIYPALMLALNVGIRDAELKNLTWSQLDLEKNILTVGRSKTDAGEGRTIPLNSDLRESIDQYAVWYRERFAEIRSEWYVFPFGSPRPCDPTRPVTTLKTSWTSIRKKAGVVGRWHDNRHTLITELAESGAGDQTIMDIAGHVSKQMLSHYSHIRTEAKRDALETVARRRRSAVEELRQEGASMPNNTQAFEGESLQKSLQSRNFEGHRGVEKARKSKILIGSSGRTRTYNPSVNRGIIKHGTSMLSMEWGGAERSKWSHLGTQFGEEFGEELRLN